MSSPSPEPQKSEHQYTSGESTDHSLLNHHICHCEKQHQQQQQQLQQQQPPQSDHHHHHSLGIPSPNPGHHHPVHVHVHPSPKVVPKVGHGCGCHHLQDADGGGGGGGSMECHGSVGGGRKVDDDRIEVSPLPPALPPRPPPRPRFDGTLNSRCRTREAPGGGGRIRKYVFWCCACGGLSTILGALFLAVYFLLRSYTSTLGYFETIPTFVPATMLMLTGLCVISLARRKNRYSYLLKVCGLCCLICALTCVLVTITTTVIHMNRLQTLRECVYTQRTRTCTCYSVLLEAHAQTDEGMRFVFDSTPDCEVIHGALYTCLRVIFGLSVTGILVCIFSCMLVYQLLSHEKKKMYWEQLELRCRSFYQQQQQVGGPPPSTHSSMRGPPMPPATYCSCCEECRYPPIGAPQMYPWDAHASERFWTPGRVGNFYSPNPGEDVPQAENRASGWNWRRLPWNRNVNQNSMPDGQRDNSLTYQGMGSSADSQYGFSNRSGGESNVPVSSTGSYSVLDNRPIGGVYVWGPPPPYSNPNSPARRPVHSPARYHHIHHHVHPHDTHCQMNDDGQNMRRGRHPKDNYENTGDPEGHHHQQQQENGENTDTSSCAERVIHTLPVRKMKKRTEGSLAVSSGAAPSCREEEEHKYHEPGEMKGGGGEDGCRFLPRLQGVENAAFQKQENSPQKLEPTESEVYFADVSSCCNISVRNDGQDSSLYDEAVEGQGGRLVSLQEDDCPQQDGEDYLSHKMGNRQMSTRSRLPFPLPLGGDEPLPDQCGIPKDVSLSSLCSSVQTPMTETTDDCSGTPVTECCQHSFGSEFLAPDAQYEVIQEDRPPPQPYFAYMQGYPQPFRKPQAAPRRNQPTNISTLIQNGLLYGGGDEDGGVPGGVEGEEEEERQGQGGHSDGTIDSGWQSGSEKPEAIEQTVKPVNV